ncbi:MULTISPECIES: AfsR/SARP family transcriptional regulator [unclassified Streptomyces]|uniref:AfsR/SARP family transcriptional regulator n=1 Tax=unclassified Streptomyces TaxID=2593676 RepID=UPI002E2AA508|nr:AfsR/SARP family transcriptional regulator [Streptomyces sp. NBC_00223]
MEIAVLGGLSVRYQGVSVVPSAGKPRQVLALLALRSGSMVRVPTLMEEIWGEHIPRSATTTLQTYILQLRRKISPQLAGSPQTSAKEVLSTVFGGYRLSRPRVYDLDEFRRLAAQGAVALDVGDAQAASATLGRALALWREPALVDVPLGRVLGVEVLGIEEQRLQVLEQRIEADLLLGRDNALVSELRMLTAQHPLQESFCAQLMIALYRSGSPWRALDVFRQLRGTLNEELGVEPSPRLQRLHQAVLSGDPGLELPGLEPRGREPHGPEPHGGRRRSAAHAAVDR